MRSDSLLFRSQFCFQTPQKSSHTPRKSPRNTPSKSSISSTPDVTAADALTPLQRRSSQYRNYMHREGPRALGSKEVPEGAENCLEGLTFVITGARLADTSVQVLTLFLYRTLVLRINLKYDVQYNSVNRFYHSQLVSHKLLSLSSTCQ